MQGGRLNPIDAEKSLDSLGKLARNLGGASVDPETHEAGRARLLTHLNAAPERRLAKRSVWIVAAALCAFVAVIAAWPRALTYGVSTGQVAAGGFVQAAQPTTISFSDGTRISLEIGSRARVADVTSEGARMVLEGGAAAVHVVHRASTTNWSFEAGPYTVAVTGTAFDLHWSGEQLDLVMHEGSVVVRGPRLGDGVPLKAGERIVSKPNGAFEVGPVVTENRPRDPARTEIAPALSLVNVPPPVGSSSASASPPSMEAPVLRETWTSRIAAGDFAGVLTEAEARGMDQTIAGAPLADLNALADAARYARRPELARRVLEAERRRFAGTTEARTAAFMLGRMLDDGGSTAASIPYFDAYLAEVASGGFRAEALGRLMVAKARSHGPNAATEHARAYLREFASGPYAEKAREIVVAAGDIGP